MEEIQKWSNVEKVMKYAKEVLRGKHGRPVVLRDKIRLELVEYGKYGRQ